MSLFVREGRAGACEHGGGKGGAWGLSITRLGTAMRRTDRARRRGAGLQLTSISVLISTHAQGGFVGPNPFRPPRVRDVHPMTRRNHPEPRPCVSFPVGLHAHFTAGSGMHRHGEVDVRRFEGGCGWIEMACLAEPTDTGLNARLVPWMGVHSNILAVPLLFGAAVSDLAIAHRPRNDRL